MSGMITHLAIANRIINLLPDETIVNRNLYYLGSIAPDAIHSREGYTRKDKKHSHLRDDITDMEFEKEENLSLFHHRVSNFINENLNKNNKLIDLYRGYVVHLLSDELFLLKIRPDFVIKMNKLGIEPTNILFRDKIIYDLDCHDFKLIDDIKELKGICEILKDMECYSVDGYVKDMEMKLNMNWLIEKYFNNEHEIMEPVYIPYNKVKSYIDEASIDIINRLSSGEVFPKIF